MGSSSVARVSRAFAARTQAFAPVGLAAMLLVTACDRSLTAPDAAPSPVTAATVAPPAGMTIYTDRAAWEAAVVAAGATPQHFDFTGLTLGTVTQTTTNYGSFSIVIDALTTGDPSFNPGISVYAATSCSVNNGNPCNVFTFDLEDPNSTFTGFVIPKYNSLVFPQNITAFGGNFAQTGFTAGTGDLTGPVTLQFGSQSFNLEDYLSATGYGFVGFVSTTPSNTITFTYQQASTLVNEIFQVYEPEFANSTATVQTPQQQIASAQAFIAATGGGPLKEFKVNGPTGTTVVKVPEGTTAEVALLSVAGSLACGSLQDLINATNAISDKKMLAADAATLVSDANAIRVAIGC